MEDKPWRNEELTSVEERFPRQKAENLEKAARSFKATTGVVCDVFRPMVALDLSK